MATMYLALMRTRNQRRNSWSPKIMAMAMRRPKMPDQQPAVAISGRRPEKAGRLSEMGRERGMLFLFHHSGLGERVGVDERAEADPLRGCQPGRQKCGNES